MHSTLLSPSLLHGTTILIVALGALMIAALAAIMALAARRTTFTPAQQWGVPLLVAALLAAWFSWSVLAVREPVIVPESSSHGQGPVRLDLLIAMGVMVAVGTVALFVSRGMRVLTAAIPPAWLIGVQVYRVAGAMFLWPYLAAGALPAAFALPAGIGDVLTGLAAPFVAVGIARNRPGASARAVAWNVFGILDLIVAPVMAVLSHTTNAGRFPLVVVPLFLGPPLGILTHLWSLRNLAIRRTLPAFECLPQGV